MKRRKNRLWAVFAGLALVVGVALAIGLQFLDSFLLQKARESMSEWSQRLGRPIEVAGLSTHVLTGVGATVEGVQVGAAPEEGMPLATAQRFEVKVSPWSALLSRGKRLHVRSVELAGLTVNVVRFPDGTTNLERLRQKLETAQEAAGATPPKDQGNPTDLSGVRLDRAEISNAKIQFVDRSGPQPHELAISNLNATVKDFGVGRPLDLTLSAAVLADKPNFQMEVHTAPLPPSLKPAVERVAIKIEPLELAPLAPFLPKSIGLLAGRLDADWKAQLGAVVPGGSGPTHLSGALHALGLRFAGAKEGKPLDVSIETQVQADATQGDLALDQLRINLGPASIDGKGQVRHLTGAKPEVQGLEITSHNFDLAALADAYPPLGRALHGDVAGQIAFSVRASGTEAEPAVAIELDLTPVRISIPDELTKSAGAPMKLTAQLHGSGGEKGLGFRATGNLSGVDFRPGGNLNKGPQDRLDFSAEGSYQASANKKGETDVELHALQVHLLDETMNAKGWVKLAGAGKDRAVSFELSEDSPRIDVDRILISSSGNQAPPKRAPTPEKGKGPGLPPNDPHRFDRIRGKLSARIGELRAKGFQLSNVVAEILCVNDEVSLQKLTAKAYGGDLALSGTQVKLGPAERPFAIQVQARDVELGDALARGGPRKALSGRFSGDVHLTGAGQQMAALSQTLAGSMQGKLVDAAFLGKDVVASLAGLLGKALPIPTNALSAENATPLGKEVPFGVTLEHGLAKLKSPLQIQRPEATLTVNGGIALNGDLQLAGTANLAPALISKITRGRVNVQEPIPLAFRVTGPASSPQVSGIDLSPAVQSIAKQAASGALGRLLGAAAPNAAPGTTQDEAQKAEQKLQDEAKKKLRGLLGQ